MPLKTQQDEIPQLNLTSMIDVVFLLIVFFMVAAKFGDDQRDIDLRLPEVGSAAALTSAPKAREVAVHSDGRVTLDREEMDMKELKNRLATARQEYPQINVVIRGDAAAAFQNVASAMAACKEAGISELGVSVRVAEAVVRAPR